MSQRSTSTHPEIHFRGVGGRNLDDQEAAIAEGYNSVLEYALDHLAKRVIALEQRVDKLAPGVDAEAEESRRRLEG